MKVRFVDVILPLPIGSTYTYQVPEECESDISVGMRVIVPFGQKKMYTAIVSLIHSNPPELYDTKPIIYILDDVPILRPPQLKFWNWIASYYSSYIGEVYSAAVPSGLKIESETQVRIIDDYESEIPLSDIENEILDMLADGKVHRVMDINKKRDAKDVMPLLKLLMMRGAVEVSEELTEKYRPKMEQYVVITDVARDEEMLKMFFTKLERSPKQLSLLMKYMELSKCMSIDGREVSQKELLQAANSNTQILNSLKEKNILSTYKKEIGRLDNLLYTTDELPTLSDAQKQAYDKILQLFEVKSTVLLHGVTSSGKTEIYIHLINSVLKQKKQVLFVVPEIVLTAQLTNRLRRVFGGRLGVYHSRFSDAERVEIWNKLLEENGYDVIIGVRSSLFLPFRELGLVIVDEEHENSFKQYNPAPRYHARNSAIVLANMHGAKTLLGSATPSIETYYNCEIGKYGKVELNVRYRDIKMPQIVTVDLKEMYRKKEMKGHFSTPLIAEIDRVLNSGEQVILFQNRRGYAPFLECKACGYVPKCKNCDVSLTVHKYLQKLTCHYCGFSETLPSLCPVCHTPNLSDKGFGTEKIEIEISEIFPNAKVARMDLDTTRSKNSYQKIISKFENGSVDILIGTQMITKGLDFEKVALVGVLNADNLLNFPDFRADERAYQLLLQVSGRAGRNNRRGMVVIQTSNPENDVIGMVKRGDYQELYKKISEDRKQFKYPPFYNLIEITVRHRDANVNNELSKELVVRLKSILGNRVVGANIPLVGRVRNLYVKNILIKAEKDISYSKVKEIVEYTVNTILSEKIYRSAKISIDIDPM